MKTIKQTKTFEVNQICEMGWGCPRRYDFFIVTRISKSNVWLMRIDDNKIDDNKKLLSKGHFVADKTGGYDEFYILNNKKLSIQSTNKIDDIKENMKPGQIKRLFAGGLKSKLQSRIVLNKFIEKVA